MPSRWPGDPRVHKNYGALLEDLKRFEDAVDSYDSAIALQPDDADAYNNLACGLALLKLGQFDPALASFDTAIALNPGYAEAYSNRGVALEDVNRLGAAAADFDKAIALRPEFSEAGSNLAHCLLKMGRFERGWQLHQWRSRTETGPGNRTFGAAALARSREYFKRDRIRSFGTGPGRYDLIQPLRQAAEGTRR